MEYCVHPRVASGLVRHQIDDGRLLVTHEKTGKHTEVAWDHVTQIRLRHDVPGVYTAHITRRTGKDILIPARSVRGIGKFDPHPAEYLAFLERLHAVSHAANPNIRFVAGSTALFWLGSAFVAIGVLFVGFIVYGLLMVDKPMPRELIIIVPVLLVAGGGFVQQGRTTNYPPDALPSRVLPDEVRA